MGPRFRRILIFTAVLLAGIGLPSAGRAQEAGNGRLTGRILDADSGRPIVGAAVALVGTQIGTTSGLDGRFTLPGVPPGTRALQVSYIGYAPKTVTEIAISPGETSALDISLAPAALALEGITISAAAERGSVDRALDAQRTAVGVMSATTAEQIARSPDGDAAQAVQRVSGVTVRDGKYVFVRGLGERYTTTSLNGARLPSPDPEKKIVPLDLFPSSLLEAITTSKTFTPDQSGDFSGAQVNLQTRSFPANRMVQYSLGFGFNAGAVGEDVLQSPTTGLEWLGLASGARAMPAALARVSDFSSLQQGQINEIVRSFPGSWAPGSGGSLPNGSASLSIGGEDARFGRSIGYIGSLTYARTQEVKQDVLRARAIPSDAAGTPASYNAFRGETGQLSTLWGGMLNLTTFLGTDHKLELNNTYDRSADNEAHVDWGTLEEFAQVDSVRRTSLRYVERSVRSNQLRAEHQLGSSNRLDWSITSSGVTRDEPDRADIAYGYEFAPSGERLPLAWLGFIPEAAKRTYAELDENAIDAALNYGLTLGEAGQGLLKLGGAFRQVQRDATSSSYNIRALGLSPEERAKQPAEIFLGDYTSGSAARLTLEPNSSGGSYSARDRVAAGYVMLEYGIAPWLRVVGGARLESWDLEMDSEPVSRGIVRTTRSNLDLLPSLALNFQLSEYQNLRISATQTLARPEYRELSPISYRDMLGEREVFGDSGLVRTLVENYDARWEIYPASGEVLSLGVFAKRFRHPIEPIDVATSGASQLSFTNAEGAANYGIEVEARKQLGFLHTALEPFTAFTNATVMRSEISTGNSQLSALTNDDRPMAGQAPYVINAGVTYSGTDGETSATLLYNVVGRRMVSAAVMPLNRDSYEMPRHLLDFSLRLPLYGDVSSRLDAKNLLGSAYEEKQGEVVRYRYQPGRVISLGVSWRM